MRLQQKTFFGNFKVKNGVVFFCIKFPVGISGEEFTQMHIITVAAEAIPFIRRNDDGAPADFFQYPCIAQYHFGWLVNFWLAVKIVSLFSKAENMIFVF
jgi:hypothetical protein